MANYIRFDWAMKRLLREKANHAVLEGFMESLLGEKFIIVDFLESEGNQETADDKFNRVDMLVKNSKDELFIFEIQNEHELTYFHRILYGTSKVITDYIHLGDDYGKIKKVYSISIVYFELGQGKDYAYHGRTDFRGINYEDDYLMLSERQKTKFFGKESDPMPASSIFPEYYILRLDNFDKVASNHLEEWINFLKTSEVDPNFSAPGLDKVRECLRVDSLSEKDKNAYYRHLDWVREQISYIQSGIYEGVEKGREEGKAEENKRIADRLRKLGYSEEEIQKIIGD